MVEKNFVVFGQGRSGSNLLRSLLNSHPNIFIDGELFGSQRLEKFSWLKKMEIKTLPIKYINYRRVIANADIYGFKMFVFHHFFSGRIVKTLYRTGWKIIYLQRRNVLKQAFSGLIGQQNKIYMRQAKTNASIETIQINPANVVSAIKFRNYNNVVAQRTLKNIPFMEIIYEDDLKNMNAWQETTGKIFRLLEIEPVVVTTNLVVTDPRPDWERIENFEEIIRFLNETGYSKVVEDYYKYL